MVQSLTTGVSFELATAFGLGGTKKEEVGGAEYGLCSGDICY